MKTKKIPAKRTTFWCIYKKAMILGKWCRMPVSAWPEREDATAALKQIADSYFLKNNAEQLKKYMSEYMVEEMPVIMKAWQP